MNEKLTIISTSAVNNDSDVSIAPLRDSSALNYKETNSSGNTYWKRLEEKSRFRPLHISELDKKLKDRGYNLGLVSQYTGTGLTMSLDPIIPEKSINITMDDSKEFAEEVLKYYIENYPEDEQRLLQPDQKELDLFDSSTQVIDIMSGIQTLELINLNSDSYTNIVSLIPLKRYNMEEGVSAKVNVGVQYTINSNIKYYSTTFTAFDYEEVEGKLSLESDNWIESINDEVQVEYINGILKALPLSNDVSECIISNCTVSYGYLNK